MGNDKDNDAFAIIVMRNKDVYYLTYQDYNRMGIDTGDWFSFEDARSGKLVKVRFAQISSVVERQA